MAVITKTGAKVTYHREQESLHLEGSGVGGWDKQTQEADVHVPYETEH